MAYHTYRNLYRIRPALSSIGQGRQRIRLPKGMSITLDVLVLTAVLWLPCSFTIGLILTLFFPFPALMSGLVLAAVIAFRLGKMDPAGKTIVAFLIDIAKFVFRAKVHDGFDDRPKVREIAEKISWKVKLAMVEDGHVASLPASGFVNQLELRVPASIQVKRGRVTIHHRGNRLQPGLYEITDEVVKAKRLPPRLGRRG